MRSGLAKGTWILGLLVGLLVVGLAACGGKKDGGGGTAKGPAADARPTGSRAADAAPRDALAGTGLLPVNAAVILVELATRIELARHDADARLVVPARRAAAVGQVHLETAAAAARVLADAAWDHPALPLGAALDEVSAATATLETAILFGDPAAIFAASDGVGVAATRLVAALHAWAAALPAAVKPAAGADCAALAAEGKAFTDGLDGLVRYDRLIGGPRPGRFALPVRLATLVGDATAAEVLLGSAIDWKAFANLPAPVQQQIKTKIAQQLAAYCRNVSGPAVQGLVDRYIAGRQLGGDDVDDAAAFALGQCGLASDADVKKLLTAALSEVNAARAPLVAAVGERERLLRVWGAFEDDLLDGRATTLATNHLPAGTKTRSAAARAQGARGAALLLAAPACMVVAASAGDSEAARAAHAAAASYWMLSVGTACSATSPCPNALVCAAGVCVEGCPTGQLNCPVDQFCANRNAMPVTVAARCLPRGGGKTCINDASCDPVQTPYASPGATPLCVPVELPGATTENRCIGLGFACHQAEHCGPGEECDLVAQRCVDRRTFTCGTTRGGCRSGEGCLAGGGGARCVIGTLAVGDACVALTRPDGELALGECAKGALVDLGGGVRECKGKPRSETEDCDGVDADCDGKDDGADGDAHKQLSSCAIDDQSSNQCKKLGHEVCTAAGKQCAPGKPTPERCDQQDNDCDDEVDEAFALGEVQVFSSGEVLRKNAGGTGWTSTEVFGPSPTTCGTTAEGLPLEFVDCRVTQKAGTTEGGWCGDFDQMSRVCHDPTTYVLRFGEAAQPRMKQQIEDACKQSGLTAGTPVDRFDCRCLLHFGTGWGAEIGCTVSVVARPVCSP